MGNRTNFGGYVRFVSPGCVSADRVRSLSQGDIPWSFLYTSLQGFLLPAIWFVEQLSGVARLRVCRSGPLSFSGCILLDVSGFLGGFLSLTPSDFPGVCLPGVLQ